MTMTSNELRAAYLKFFESKGHLILPSDLLVPDDPTLLYTSAGMVQFKPYFVGERVPPCRRIATCQKCLRTDDVDEVGDAVHHTFFEMLGNFSFGDYFKREAITWAWEFLTDVLKLDPDHIWTSVYLDDDEAADVWIKEIGFPADKVVRLGEDKNYWPANAPSKGPNGPCGPCNEIFLDVTPDLGPPDDPTWAVAHDPNRFVELWNLVFTQFDRLEDGTLKPLPAKNIDTGMGLERTAAVLQGTPTDYETDLFLPTIQRIETISGAKYGSNEDVTRAIRVVADHVRGAVFAIADGVMPSNVGRGYVLRRIIRRAVLRGNVLGLGRPFMHELVGTVVEITKDVYPEPKDRQDYVTSLIRAEEEKFRRTLDVGMSRLTQQIAQVKRGGEKQLSGEAAFSLHDTYGFPLELTQEIAAAEGIEVDVAGFEAAMDDQRARAKEASGIPTALFEGGTSAIVELEQTVEPTKFVGYQALEADATVLALLEHGEQVSVARQGNLVDVVLDVTPFYAEAGGQVGDEGQIRSSGGEGEAPAEPGEGERNPEPAQQELRPSGAVLRVKNTARAGPVFLHSSEVLSGEIKVGDRVHCEVDRDRRMSIARNHTATHLLHAALRRILGPHALQSGSVVEPGRLRFDFSHFQALTPEEIRRIEDEVNERILEDIPVEVIETTVEEARKMGATALFGEKYGERVRVMKVGDYSTELCGGTHLHRTSQVGFFKIVSESSVGAGLRRIEAVTGRGAVQHVHDVEDILDEVSEKLGVSPGEAGSALGRLQASLKDAQRRLKGLQAKSAAEQAQELAAKAQNASGVNVVTSKLATANAEVLSSLADEVANRLSSGVVILGGVSEGKILFVSKVTPDLVARGFHAGNLIREVAKVAGGGGGGKAEFAQAGGKDASKVDEALETAVALVQARAIEG